MPLTDLSTAAENSFSGRRVLPGRAINRIVGLGEDDCSQKKDADNAKESPDLTTVSAAPLVPLALT
jgi:hypothetical protein